MTKKLRWAAGRFVYPKGKSDHPVHYSPFQDFQLDDGPDFAHLFLVRARRYGNMSLSEEPVAEAIVCSAAPLIAELAGHLAGNFAGGKPPLSIMEFYPGVGVTFERIKQSLESRPPDPPGPGRARFAYCACGEESFKLRFDIVHGEDAYPVEYITDGLGDSAAILKRAEKSDLVIYNADEAVHHRCDQNIDLEKVIAASEHSILIASRVLSPESDGESESLMTVRGRTVTIPGLKHFLNTLRMNGPEWRYRFYPDFDANLFLPGKASSTGVCLAFRSSRDISVPEYRSISSVS